MSNLFSNLDRSADLADSKRAYNRHHFLRDMNDAKKRAKYDTARLDMQSEGATVRRVYERADWAEFVPTMFLEPLLENTTYTSTSGQLADSITVPSGLTFVYKEFENFQRAQRGGENTEFERRKGKRATQEVALHTLGARSYVTEEEMLDIPVDSMQLELRTMGAALGLERDLLWMDSLYRATSGANSVTYNNNLVSKAALDFEGLFAVITWFTSPFAKDLTTITLSNPWDTTEEAKQVEGLMKLGKFRVTDVLMGAESYFNIVNNTTLQAQYVWNSSKILDTGQLNVPLLGCNFHKVNMGYFADPDDPESWIDTDDIIFCDRRMGGCGTIGVRQPLQVRQWDMPSFRTQDFQIFERVGFAVQNRRGLVRVRNGAGS